MLFRLGIFPLFLFCGAFFPISNLGTVGEWVARCTPLWHGVNLSRMFALDNVTWWVAAVNVDGAGRAHRGRLVLGGLRPREAAGLMTALAACSPCGALVRGHPAAGPAQLHRLPQGLEAVRHRLPRAGLLPALDRHRRRAADRHLRVQRPARCPYAEFVAPGMLAASAMNGALLDSTFNIFFKLSFIKLYDQMLATPLTTARRRARRDRVVPAARVGATPPRSCVIMAAMGLVHSWWAVLALPADAADRVRVRARSAWR